MSAFVSTRTMSGMADVGLAWLTTLLARRWHRHDAWTEDSRLALEERILATQTEIVAMQRSLAMQKQAMDAAQSARRSTPAQAPAVGLADSSPKLDLPLDDEGLSCYADTEPMPYLDMRPHQPGEIAGPK